MSSPPLVLDVVPPPELPPVRSRSGSRWWSMLLVTVILGLVPVLALTPSARAYVWVVPVAKAVGATAVSWALGEAVETLDKDDGNGGKKKGKWGDKLKGIPGLAVGVLGALWGVGEGIEMFDGDGDGLEMPEELKEDVPNPDGEWFNSYTGRSTFTIENVEWSVSAGGAASITTTASMTCDHADPAECLNPNGAVGSSRVQVRCYNPRTGQYYEDGRTGVVMNGTLNLVALCKADGVNDPIQSAYIRMHTDRVAGRVGRAGLTNPQRWINPHFDPSISTPDTTVTAETSCTEVGTGNVQTVSKTVQGTDVMPLAACPVGWQPQSTGWTANAGQDNSEWLGGVQPTTPEAYPDCPPGECVRIIEIDGQPCNAHRPDCFDWMNTQPPSRLKCEFGPYDMPIAECADLEHIHKSTHGVTWAPDPDGTPKWMPAKPDGTPDPTRVGTIWAPEENPNWNYRPPLQGPLITFTPGTGTDPTPNPNPNPNPNPAPDPTAPVVNPPTGIKDLDDPTKNCMGGMASWNPVDWVVTPVKCALTWAFVPKNGSGPTLINDAKLKFTGAGLAPWLAVPPMLFGDLPEGSGCQGPALTMPASMGGKTYYPLNACSDPMAKYANMSRSLITIVVVFYGGFSIVNSLTVALTGYRMFERETAVAESKVNT